MKRRTGTRNRQAPCARPMRMGTRTTSTQAAFTLSAAFLALVTACGSGPSPAPKPPAAGEADVLVRVRAISGTPSPQVRRALPRLSLYGDGRAITPSGRTGALQTATVHRLTDERVREVYRDAYATARTAVETPDAVDGGVLELTVAAADHTGTSRAEPETTRLPLPADESTDFLARTDPARWPDGAFADAPRRYEPTVLAVFAMPADKPGAESAAWPYDDPGSTGTPTPEGTCTVLSPDRTRAVQRLARAATQETLWRAGGHTYRLDFRPLLPDEADCGDLDGPGAAE